MTQETDEQRLNRLKAEAFDVYVNKFAWLQDEYSKGLLRGLPFNVLGLHHGDILKLWIDHLRIENRALRDLFIPALADAQWWDKVLYPALGEPYQNWKLTVYLPTPVSGRPISPEEALERAIAQRVAELKDQA